MTTSRLLWGMTWEGIKWGVEFGGKCGAIYGIIIGIWKFVTYWLLAAFPIAWYELFPMSVGYALYCGFAGIIEGFLLGVIEGLLAGISTYLYFACRKNMKLFSQLVLLPTSGGVAISGWLLFNFFAELYFGTLNDEGPAYQPTIADHIFFSVIPTIIAIGCAIVASQRLARWYERESQKGTAQNVTPN